jgi:glucose/arabinose dehydrogenase
MINQLITVALLSVAAFQTVRANNSVTAPDTAAVRKGKELFQTYCTSCHNFKQKGIGPNLNRAIVEMPAFWVKKFIENAPGMIAKKDPRAVRLLAEYKQMMPAFTMLSDADLDAIVLYIDANQTRSAWAKRPGAEGLKDPVPTKIATSRLTLQLETMTTAPVTATATPTARINKMAALPGPAGERVFVQELRGQLYELVGNDWRVAMDISQLRPNFIPQPGLATGFGSFAFHPDFYQNGLLYTSHTEKPNSAPADFAYPDSIKVTLQWVITEWKITDPKATALTGEGRELVRINMVTPMHGMQELAFNPTAKKGSADYGLLYVGVGDGGASENGYPFICNDKRDPWSAVWRIDPQGRNSRNGQYGIPATNPFANDADPSTVREIYCRGFRNPNRLTWTPDGRLLITDIGHANIEEINVAVPGGNFGWPNREGSFVINPAGRMDQVYKLPANEKPSQYVYPAAQYDHDEGKAISGGFVYTGTSIPQLRGQYLFGDVVSGRLFGVDAAQLKPGQQAPITEYGFAIDGKPTTFQAVNGQAKTDLRFGQGAGGELFIMTKSDGRVYRVKALR